MPREGGDLLFAGVPDVCVSAVCQAFEEKREVKRRITVDT